ncbi:EAL domain-containing protein [Sulfurospirillum sp. 1612]|uniref:EAL domain-containing protein n=1 Tax=Sulfurospirillum sp. 1612 TaxID=3094835 RepID=UPI002F94107B
MMSNNISLKFKNLRHYADQIILIILALIGLSLYIFYEINAIDKKEKSYISISNSIHSLELINKDFDNFFLNRKIVINYDKIETKISDFTHNLQFLKNALKKRGYDPYLEKIKTDFSTKKEIIEKYKSYSAFSLYTLLYIINNTRDIKARTKGTLSEIKQIHTHIDASLYSLIETYLNLDINKNQIDQSLAMLKDRDIPHPNAIQLLEQMKTTLEKITYVDGLRKKAALIPLENDITTLNTKFNQEHNRLVYHQNRILYIIFTLSVFLILLLFFTYIRTLQIKKELLAFKYAVENSDDSIVITDKDRLITYVNDASVKTSGYRYDEVIGKNPNILRSEQLSQDFYDEINRVLASGRKWSGEFINKKKNGEIYYEKSSITPMMTNNKLTGYLAIKLDVTDYVHQKEKMEYLAYHDSLTALPNRLCLKNMLFNMKNDLNHNILSLLFIDIDGFKTINDAIGHETGDEILKKIAHMLCAYTKKDNSVFRIGGDEFAILSLDKDDESIRIAHDILNLFKDLIIIDNFKSRISISIGIATCVDGRKDTATLIKQADIALNQVKEHGKNSYMVFNKELSDRIQQKWQIEQALATALKNHEFYVVYQPKYNLKSKKLISLEALIRWNHPKLGQIPPDYFIPIAEDLSLIHEIGNFVFRKACEDFTIIKQQYPYLENISVNVSASQLVNKTLLRDFQSIMDACHVKATDIGIEVTETHIMYDIDENITSLQQMREEGFQIVLDDFGTGYASMAYLKNLPIEVLKIDKTFVDNISIDASDINIVKATIAISRSLGYKTVAEGIETKAQEDILRNLGVDEGQGYFYSEPKTREALIALIKTIS